MILCHEYRFIFLKTNKTAGNSIEIALSKFCGDRDIITPFSPEAQALREARGYRGPQNHLAPIWSYGARDLKRLILGRRRKMRFYNHIRARELVRLLPPEIWKSYYKFCVVRDPFERCVSMYYWYHRTEPRPTFTEFLASDVPLKLKSRGHNLYTLDGKVAVDRFCRFERLEEDLERVRLELGLPEPLELGKANTKFRADKRPHREIIAPGDRERIRELFREEIEMFGY